MDINTNINILGGMPDYNLIRIYIAGEVKDKSSSEVQLQYTSIKIEKAFKTDNLKKMKLPFICHFYQKHMRSIL